MTLKYKLIFLSLLTTTHSGLYINKEDGSYVLFGFADCDITDENNWEKILAPLPPEAREPNIIMLRAEKMKNAFLNSKAIQKMIYTLLSGIQNPLPETLPLPIISRMQLMSSTDALRNIHFPVTIGHLRRAEFRLKFEELFYLQLHILRYTRLRNLKWGGFRFDPHRELFQRLLSSSVALRTHPSSKTSHQRDSSRYGQRQTNEQTVTGRCRQWKNIGRAQ